MQTDGDGEESDATDETPRCRYDRYTSDHKIILEPTGLWFMDNCVVRGVTKSTKTNFVGPIPTSWTQASPAQRDAWFNNFRQAYAWSPSQERNVRIRYEEVGTRRYRDVIWKVVRRPKEPENMKGDKYEGLIKHTKTPAFQKKSKQASLNKRGGKEDAVNEPTHYAGSRSLRITRGGSRQQQDSYETNHFSNALHVSYEDSIRAHCFAEHTSINDKKSSGLKVIHSGKVSLHFQGSNDAMTRDNVRML
ncbi:uncharacterized protein LOC141641212 [Silene latifolia]|uniref:uncharacterized protein LOC141641212 n=1 Tax=Silene latifolia TaxID=37657 RepID=UPI003D77A1F5